MHRKEAIDALRAAGISDKARKVLILTVLEGQTDRYAARRLGQSRGSIRDLRYWAMKKFPALRRRFGARNSGVSHRTQVFSLSRPGERL